jgi:hypothetical protein
MADPKSNRKIMGAVGVNLFRFIPTAILAFGTPSRKFSLLKNFTRRALQRITSRPVFKKLAVDLSDLRKLLHLLVYDKIQDVGDRET